MGRQNQEGPLRKEMVTHPRTFAWKIPPTEKPGRLQTMGSQSDMTEQLHFIFLFLFFFKFKFIYFNWRLITLQYCIGFAIHHHESATGVHMFPILYPLPPPFLYPPSESSQRTSPKHPVSCIEPGLVICFIYNRWILYR